MGAIKRFEEIRGWQKARELVNAVYLVTKSGQFSKDFGLRDQIRRAAGSIMHNIAEGFDSGSDPEFRRFLRFSIRSVAEVQSQLYTALDQAYISKEQFDKVYEQAETVKAHVRKFVSYLSSMQISENGSTYQTENELVSTDDIGRWTSDDFDIRHGTSDENDN